MKQDILDMLNKYYDAYKEDYMSMFGEESNNYLFIDSDLELHIEQEDKHHIFVSLFNLGKKYNWEGWSMKNIVIEKMTVYIASNKKYDNVTEIIDTITDLGRSSGDFTVIDWDNPTEFNLVERIESNE